jgi:hypothetical protein
MMLLLMSLRFDVGPSEATPSTKSILVEVKEASIRALQKATSWEDRDTELSFCSNYVCVHIAYVCLSPVSFVSP